MISFSGTSVSKEFDLLFSKILIFLGCSKCTTNFTIDTKTDNVRDIGGFDQTKWTARNGEDHKSTGFALLQHNTLEKIRTEERKTGVRFSELFRLPYHDPIRSHVIDPMHNLFLGKKHSFVHFFILNCLI